MGHTEGIHNAKYVTPLPVLQIWKVGANLLRRWAADASTTYPEVDELPNQDEGTLPSLVEPTETTEIDGNYVPNYDELSEEDHTRKKKRPKVNVSWTFEEQEIVIKAFKTFFYSKTPGKKTLWRTHQWK